MVCFVLDEFLGFIGGLGEIELYRGYTGLGVRMVIFQLFFCVLSGRLVGFKQVFVGKRVFRIGGVNYLYRMLRRIRLFGVVSRNFNMIMFEYVLVRLYEIVVEIFGLLKFGM